METPGILLMVANAGNDKLTYALDTGAYQAGYVFATTVAGNHTIHVKNEFGCIVDTVITVGIDNASSRFSFTSCICISKSYIIGILCVNGRIYK
jgi:hypothetical protein